MTRAVVFDYFGTLTAATPDAVYALQRGAVAECLGADPVAFAAAVRASFDDRASARTGGLPATLRSLARSVGADPDDEQVTVAVSMRLTSERLNAGRIRQDARVVLETLAAQRISRGVLSDCGHELSACWDGLPLAPLVDAAVLSFREGCRKPDPRMYATVSELLGVKAADCVYVGDGGSGELAGAAAVGMTPLRLVAPDHASHVPYDVDDFDCPRIGDLREVLWWV